MHLTIWYTVPNLLLLQGLDIINYYINLKQIIKEPTGVTATSETLIGHIYISNRQKIAHSTVVSRSMQLVITIRYI